jgi:hypothetical protein
MFTVMRILSTSPSDANLVEVAAAMNRLTPDARFEPRYRGDGLAATVSVRSDWPAHASEIEQFLTLVGQNLRSLVDTDHEVTLDIAIEPDDTPSPLKTFGFSRRLIGLLEGCGASLEVSVYAGE